MSKAEDPWGEVEITQVKKRAPLPMTERGKALREGLPDPMTMTIGQEAFAVTYGHEMEEQAIKQIVRRSRAHRQDAVVFSLPEWRAHVRGRLMICVHPAVAPEWEELQRIITAALVRNKKPPPLSPQGNALVPRLRTAPD
ncbi:hypothetical protein [Planktothrix phage Pra-JY27]|nr:hypothetical protein [Planktothrix phage Pag-Yong1]WEV89241.1 hypothetical protein [Synechococcus phage MinM2]